MKIVIQCAATKDPQAGYFKAADNRPIKFVAHPDIAPKDGKYLHAHPDDQADSGGKTWRDRVFAYNKEPSENAFGLVPAYRLYRHPTYRALVDRFGIENVYILSAGWGLIRSDFLTPQYDITFSASADAYKHRKKRDAYSDLCQLSDETDEPVIFLGGKDYLPLFCKLTAHIRSERIVFYNSKTVPDAPDCRLVKYETTTRTNWHYGCAANFERLLG